MLVCLFRRRSVRCLCFPLEKTTFELNFSAMKKACCSATHVHFTNIVVMDRLDTRPKREATSRRVNLFRNLCQVVDRIFTKHARSVSGMLRVMYLVLIHVPI